jgi:hypothetical protein
MKKLILVIFLMLPAAAGADESSVAQAVTIAAQADGDYDSSKYPFGAVAASGITRCAHKNTSQITMQDLSPIDLQGRWHFKIRHKDKPSDVLDVTGMIEYTKTINNENYYFYGVPLENKGNLIKFGPDCAYIRNLKYPVFSFIFLDVELEPQMRFMQYPMKAGDSWKADSEGVVDILGLFKIKMKTNARFNVLSVEDVLVDGRLLHVYKIENLVERGTDGKIFREVDWFAAGSGLMYQDTEAYTLELEKYSPGPDNRERFLKMTVPADLPAKL